MPDYWTRYLVESTIEVIGGTEPQEEIIVFQTALRSGGIPLSEGIGNSAEREIFYWVVET